MHKKLLFIPAAALLSAVAVAVADIPEASVPVNVVNAVKAAFPKAGPIEWDKDGVINKHYEADFLVDGLEVEVEVSPEGQILRAKEDLAPSSVPEAVRAAALKQLAGSRIEDAKKITEGQAVRYEVEVEAGNKDLDVTISADGKVLRVER